MFRLCDLAGEKAGSRKDAKTPRKTKEESIFEKQLSANVSDLFDTDHRHLDSITVRNTY